MAVRTCAPEKKIAHNDWTLVPNHLGGVKYPLQGARASGAKTKRKKKICPGYQGGRAKKKIFEIRVMIRPRLELETFSDPNWNVRLT
jgi:hypothetical protein